MASRFNLQDIETALDVLDTYKKVVLERNMKQKTGGIKNLIINSQRMTGIDELEDYLTDHAFEAPVVILIEDFIYKMNVRMAESGEGTKRYQFFKNMRDAADDISEFFL